METGKGADRHNTLFALIFLEKSIKMNLTLTSSLEAEMLDPIVVDVQNFLDLVVKLDVDKSWGQLGIHPRV